MPQIDYNKLQSVPNYQSNNQIQQSSAQVKPVYQNPNYEPHKGLNMHTLIIIISVIILILIVFGMTFLIVTNLKKTDRSLCESVDNRPDCIGKATMSLSACKKEFSGVMEDMAICYTAVALTTGSTNPCIELKSKQQSAICVSRVAYSSSDFQKCNDILKMDKIYGDATTLQYDTCLMNFPVFVEGWSDSRVCDKITSTKLKESCTHFAKLAEK